MGLVLAVLGVLAFAWRQEMRFDGEYGLVVFIERDTLEVRWLTGQAGAGMLEIAPGPGGTPVRVLTPSSFRHQVRVPLPRQDEVVLTYGREEPPAAQHRTVVSLRAPSRAPPQLPAVDSLYIIGDTHGMLTELQAGMRGAGLIDSAGHWSGGRRHVVFAGDLLDRGPDVLPLLWFVYRLEREAAHHGGGVHTLLGNHEIMVLLGDLRYVHGRERHVAELHDLPYDRMFNVRTSLLGRWLASRPALMRIGRVLIAHGGVAPEMTFGSVAQVNDTLAAYMSEDLFHYWADTTKVITIDSLSYQRREDFFWDSSSLFWHRAFVQADTLGAQLDSVLRHFDSDVLVVGHTPVDTSGVRYDGRLIAAHTPQYGAEFVLLVRAPQGLQRFRVRSDGTTTPF